MIKKFLQKMNIIIIRNKNNHRFFFCHLVPHGLDKSNNFFLSIILSNSMTND